MKEDVTKLESLLDTNLQKLEKEMTEKIILSANGTLQNVFDKLQQEIDKHFIEFALR